MINHKRVRVTSKNYYVFFPFGIHLSRGFASQNRKEIDKAISRENKLQYVGLSGLVGLYIFFHNNKSLWVGLLYAFIAALIFLLLYFSAKTAFSKPEKYSQELHGSILSTS